MKSNDEKRIAIAHVCHVFYVDYLHHPSHIGKFIQDHEILNQLTEDLAMRLISEGQTIDIKIKQQGRSIAYLINSGMMQ